MNGPQQFREAERHIEVARAALDNGHPDAAARALAFANVHATLALAAAFADPYGPDEHVWREVLS